MVTWICRIIAGESGRQPCGTLDDTAPRGSAIMRRITRVRPASGRAAMLHDAALMLAIDAVLDERAPGAANSAPAQLRVELLQHLRGDLADRHATECRLDVPADVRLVPAQRVICRVVNLQPGVKRLAQGGPGPRGALLVDLGQKPP
jgi:hypothetical protein